MSRLVPRRVAFYALAVELHCPDVFQLGEQTRFLVAVRNRLPIPVRVELPSSRLWGWAVDDNPEADARGYEPPRDNLWVTTFRRGEQRAFEAVWDGRIRRHGGGESVWEHSPGTYELTGYLAVEHPEKHGLYARRTVEVVEPN